MLDKQQSENNEMLKTTITKIENILFRKLDGIADILPKAADENPDNALLQIYTAIMYFFSFSQKVIETELPKYLTKLHPEKLNERELLYYDMLRCLEKNSLIASLKPINKLVTKYPDDIVAISMLETCGFLGGRCETLAELYEKLFPHYQNDPDFLGNYAMLQSHLDAPYKARKFVEQGLRQDPHNAWLQHVYSHTLEYEVSSDIKTGIEFMEQCQADWPKQNRFFEGHNWMHLAVLYLHDDPQAHIEKILNAYPIHLFGSAKEMLFEQNNAFLVLLNAELNGCKIPHELWNELAVYAEPFLQDYFTPYFTVTCIMTIAKVDAAKANQAFAALKKHVAAMPNGSAKQERWQRGIDVLAGCLDYINGDYQNAYQKLKDIYDKTRIMGHSDEQRAVFPAIYQFARKAIKI